MKKNAVKLETLKIAVQFLGYKQEDMNGVMTMKDGSRMTTELHIFRTPEGLVLLNLSNAITFEFETEEEFQKYLNKKFELFESEKDMYMNFCGMDEETWEEWNS